MFPTFAVGGAQARFCAVANHFGRRWRHAIVAMDGNTACRERLDSGLDVCFPEIALPKGATLANLRRIRAALTELRPQTLVTSNWGAIEWAMANAARPLVRQIHTEDGFGPEERATQIRRRVLTRRLVLRGCTVVLPSRTLLAIATNIWRLPRRRLHHVPNGVDLARFSPRGPLAINGQTLPGPLVIGAVAALRPEKNLARLLRAVALAHTTARLVIVGDGAGRAALEALAESLGLGARVAFAGHQADPAAFYAGFDVFALSSDTEQMPLTVLEAMAAGLPVAATDVGDVATMVAPQNRPFVVAADDAALAGSLRRLLEDAPLRHAVGAANRARAEQVFDQAGMFAAYGRLFDGMQPEMDNASPGGLSVR